MASNTTLFRARVPAERLENAANILRQLGINPGDAFNMMLAQIELHKGLPFKVTTEVHPLLSSDEQAKEWQESLGAY